MKQFFSQQLNAASEVTYGDVILVSLLVAAFFAATFIWAKRSKAF